jgi:5-methyltetrahydropteroyltriglutamate--homocysteine methyltransferase
MAVGGYEPVAERVFGADGVDLLFLEFDNYRSGGFEPLRLVRDGVGVVLGIISSKTPELESRETLLARVEDASRFVPVERLGVSPQCGFASTIGGNPVTLDQQRRKLEVLVSVSQEVWGRS